MEKKNQKDMQKTIRYNAAAYCRLSQDDGNGGESESIQTQRTMLGKYCKEHGFPIGDYYCDDGYSGTNFNRPEFQRMIDDIESGKINLVVVKDLSRFGRDYSEMGRYIEHYFDGKGVRFISIGEDFDSINGFDNLMLPFTNVINTFYARQASSKTKAAQRTRAESGMYMGGHAPFGYIKDPNDRHHLIVDPPAAEVVKEIFQMFADGIGYVKMTKILRERHVLNPQAYFNQNNPDFYKADYWRKDFDWHATSIRTILTNPVYLGHEVFGRTKNKSYYNKKRVKTDPSEWVLVQNTHEPLVSQELWDTVQQMMKAKRRENVRGEVQPYAGLVKCADCGSSLNVSYSASRGKYTGFSCWVYKNYGKERCSSHYISWDALNSLVIEDIQRNAKAAAFETERYIKMLRDMKSEIKRSDTDKAKRELKRAEKRISELTKILNKLYEDLALEKISEERYQSMAPGYEQELAALKEKQTAITSAVEQTAEIDDNIEHFLPLIQKYTDVQEVNARILNELIEKIVVHEKETDSSGNKTQQVDIYYRFIGCITLPDRRRTTFRRTEEEIQVAEKGQNHNS